MASDTPPRWNIVSVALPLAVAALGLLFLFGGGSAGGDYAGRLGSAVLFVIGIGGACAIGEIAAIVAHIRGERLSGLKCRHG